MTAPSEIQRAQLAANANWRPLIAKCAAGKFALSLSLSLAMSLGRKEAERGSAGCNRLLDPSVAQAFISASLTMRKGWSQFWLDLINVFRRRYNRSRTCEHCARLAHPAADRKSV